MRWTFFIIFLCTSTYSCCQEAAFDMGKASVYCESYPVKDDYSGKILQGTGFIVEYRSLFYFITSYHNINNHDFYTDTHNTAQTPFKQMRLIMQRKIDNKWESLFVDLINEDSTYNFYRTKYNGNDADVVAIPLNDLRAFLIQPVAIPRTNKLKKDDIVFICGFPAVSDEAHFQLLQFGKIIPNPRLNDTYERFKDYPLQFINRPTSAGFSGSPVYVWTHTRKSPVLAGINAAVDVKNGISIFWQIEVLQNLLASIPSP